MNSNLQIISGKWRGKKLSVPIDARPTQNRARIALFNMIESMGIKPGIVWDVFAGSGAFGIECLSRYDAEVIFTDNSQDSINTIKSNLKNITGNFKVEKSEAIDFIKKYAANADLFFLDPPYEKDYLGKNFVQKLAIIAKSGAIIVWEMENENFHPIIPENWSVLKDKKYGRARFIIIKKA
ncbi:MAG: 16S rRNA (guanine(966)-N(2))-methyltransferase RsmD [Alphaproteobacteria bacterium]|nr:16S rRNA (guanine(966)-N(2))-methyltransferase RsmD [Alphaproteobacteria bacterium]MBN2675244.1 16S rRNA (guanine(966)-N(2))-methyltransferase RsmD [Alphaproteobacteria bacterium]